MSLAKYREFRGRGPRNRVSVRVDHMLGYSFVVDIYDTGPLSYFSVADLVYEALRRRKVAMRDVMFAVV